MGANVFGLVSKDVLAATIITGFSEHCDDFGCCDGDGFLGNGVVPSVDWSIFGRVVDGRDTAVHFAPELDWAKDLVICFDLCTSLHFLAALLVDVRNGNVMCEFVEVVLVGIDCGPSSHIKEFDVAE